LQSRCQTLKVIPPNKLDILKHLVKIVKRENISTVEDDLRIIVDNNYPDVRKMLNTIQVSTTDNKLNLDTTALVSSNYIKDVLKELSNGKSWTNIRQIIANANVKDFEELYRTLYEKSSEYAPGKEGMVAFHINEYSYQSNFRIDKEINCMALINQLIKLN